MQDAKSDLFEEQVQTTFIIQPIYQERTQRRFCKPCPLEEGCGLRVNAQPRWVAGAPVLFPGPETDVIEIGTEALRGLGVESGYPGEMDAAGEAGSSE